MLIIIDEAGSDAERLEQLSERVRADLLELDVEDVKRVSEGSAPPGTRGIDLAAVSAFIVAIGGSAEAINQVVTAMRAWVGAGRAAPRAAELTIGDKTLKLSDATLAQQERLIDEFARAVRADLNKPA